MQAKTINVPKEDIVESIEKLHLLKLLNEVFEIKPDNKYIIYIGSEERPASLDDIEHFTDSIRDFLGENIPPILVSGIPIKIYEINNS